MDSDIISSFTLIYECWLLKLCLTKQSKELGSLIPHGNLQEFKYFYGSKIGFGLFFFVLGLDLSGLQALSS